MQLFLKTPPAQEPLTLEEVKAYLRLPSDQEDDYLRSLIVSARAYVENATGRALIEQKWLMQLRPPYPCNTPLIKAWGKNLEIKLPYPPLWSVESVKSQGKPADYRTEDNKVLLPPFLWDKEISITYWAGYGKTAGSLPPDLKMAVLMAVRCFYDQQPMDLALLKPFKVYRLV
ncbi:MAG TPA: head-tail connector protein [Alphaproteobacteria bacterium]|nr:head-tail connector protein [Alphaproteobacteria bacterium]